MDRKRSSLLAGFLALLLILALCVPAQAESTALSGGAELKQETGDECRPGDVNDDGVVNGQDIVRLMKWLSGEDVYINRQNADVTLDETVDARDLLHMISLMAGMIVLF